MIARQIYLLIIAFLLLFQNLHSNNIRIQDFPESREDLIEFIENRPFDDCLDHYAFLLQFILIHRDVMLSMETSEILEMYEQKIKQTKSKIKHNEYNFLNKVLLWDGYFENVMSYLYDNVNLNANLIKQSGKYEDIMQEEMKQLINDLQKAKDYNLLTHTYIYKAVWMKNLVVSNNDNLNSDKSKRMDYKIWVDLMQEGYLSSLNATHPFAKASGQWSRIEVIGELVKQGDLKLSKKELNQLISNHVDTCFNFIKQIDEGERHFAFKAINMLLFITDLSTQKMKLDDFEYKQNIDEYSIELYQKIKSDEYDNKFIKFRHSDINTLKRFNLNNEVIEYCLELTQLYNQLSKKSKFKFYRMQRGTFFVLAHTYKELGDIEKSLIYMDSALYGIRNNFGQFIGTYSDADPQIFEITNKLKETVDEERAKQFLLQVSIPIVAIIIGSFAFFFWQDKNRKKELAENYNQLNNNKAKLFSIISHDLLSPINFLRQSLRNFEKSENDKLDDDSKAKIIAMQSKTAELFFLIENTLNWSKLNLDGISATYEQVEINGLINNQINLFNETIEEKNVTIRLISDGKLKAYADTNIINIISRNLIHNAIKFCNKKSTILIHTRREDNQIFIRVINEGEQIPQDLVDRVMSNRVDLYKKSIGKELRSTGVGLFMISDLARIHNGKIEVFSPYLCATEAVFSYTEPTSEE